MTVWERKLKKAQLEKTKEEDNSKKLEKIDRYERKIK